MAVPVWVRWRRRSAAPPAGWIAAAPSFSRLHTRLKGRSERAVKWKAWRTSRSSIRAGDARVPGAARGRSTPGSPARRPGSDSCSAAPAIPPRPGFRLRRVPCRVPCPRLPSPGFQSARPRRRSGLAGASRGARQAQREGLVFGDVATVRRRQDSSTLGCPWCWAIAGAEVATARESTASSVRTRPAGCIVFLPGALRAYDDSLVLNVWQAGRKSLKLNEILYHIEDPRRPIKAHS